LVYLGHVTHFGDERLNLYGRDILFKNAKECDEAIISNFNNVIGKNDVLFHLGDVSMNEKHLDLISKINCNKKFLIKGNYDKKDQTAKYEVSDELLLEYFDKVEDYFVIRMKVDGKNTEDIYLVHEPEKMREDLFCLVGHIHSLKMVFYNNGKGALNVGVDAHHFFPVSLERVRFYLQAIRSHYDQNVWWK